MQVATFIHGNRLEVLADRLIDDELERLDADPLRAQVIVVAHPALGRWLQERIARRLGIAANIEFPLPSSFAWNILRDTLGDLPKESAFSREALVWRIHAALPQLARQPRFGAVRRYLGDGGDARRRHDLAVQLARSYDEYMVARPEWLAAWSRGDSIVDDEHEAWQAELWRHLVATTEEPDRATLMARAVARLHDPAPLPDTLPRHAAVFGAAFLPPLLLEFFLALSTRLPLRFYQPNPCLDYWGDIVSDRERLQGLWKTHRRRESLAHAEAGHPLLASWGVLGREYLKEIHAPELVVHDDDAFVPPDSSHLLGWLQKGILLLDPEHDPPPSEALLSIELHGCPDRRREVEVLRDRLLAMIEQRSDLLPHDILVMSPQIDAYVPYIDAVFGSADEVLALPYRISDVALSRVHPLIDAFLRVLALGDSRFAVSDVLGLLAEPAIARRCRIDANGLSWIATWLEQAAVRWGLDAAFRESVGAAAIDENTWRFGFDRLLLGHALGDAGALVAGIAPVANVEGADAQALGELARFVDALVQTREGFATPRTADDWKTWLGARLDTLFDTEPVDAAELWAVRALREAISDFAAAAEPWLDGERLPFEVVRAVLEATLTEPGATRAGRFGITFCGMVPMRNVPHRVVCVLGLDAGVFPRRQPAPGFHLMRRHPRRGDRSVREDDRFLFLEALVAARDVFYLSHVDRDAKSGDANPPSPLVEELFGFLRDAHGDAWKEVEPRLRFRHRLHPFDPAYFGGDTKLRSYDAAWCAAAEALLKPLQAPRAFAADARALAPPVDDPATIELDDLLAWLRAPVGAWFGRALPLRIDVDEALDDSEPFDLDGLERYALGTRLLDAGDSRPDLQRARREGRFPLGPVGDARWQALAESAATIDAVTRDWLGDGVRPLDAGRRNVAIAGTSRHLAGTPRLLVEGDMRRALLLRRAGRIRGLDLARLALERILLGAEAADLPARAIGLDKHALEHVELGALADEAAWLAAVVGAFLDGRRWPVPVFRNAADAWAKAVVRAGQAVPQTQALKAWEGNEYHRGDSDEPLNALFTRDGEAPLGDDFEARASAIYVPLHAACREVKP
ncbi:MAG TPA: exodeoxyribonuclease V subunit gamma [Dokdonella sp.]|uniref:exodeoxyribonuclease V subunit gamma n=1 Tax=Dokdonella sp. TaxID=2291710 RepID=UPI0025C5434D|nr:exodeoxyribonuclease V subunit gamma [Dokdonella sp.]MBX3692259.1 exodeoxyribonuclease V subunit gamma [Dokdonella sp.]MCW5567109.1 exodeoxyribonuclease V subunit gamma [Dokdonella sp.]HNR91467.1 exodeoxyribonuclease V subunit gamma [Dokdonella sp.]